MSDFWTDFLSPDLGLAPADTNGIGPDPVIVFESLRAFLKRELPPAESLVGVTRNGTNLLPRYGWVMPWGREGSGKTSILVDLLFHAAAGLDWLSYPIDRPLRIVVIVNEGIPGGFQDKLAQKLEAWPGDTTRILDNLAIYASPWGEFSFRNALMTAHARGYALDFRADYVALDPLHTLGSSGSGKPEETEAFKHVLRAFGLWQDLGILTAHHSNKSGMVSGDWARHADTVIHLEKDGKNPATKLTLEKARPADPLELGVPMLLEWVTDTLGYNRVTLETTPRVSDALMLAKVLAALTEAGEPQTMGALQKRVGGDTKRVQAIVVAELKKGETGAIRNISTHARAYALVPGETEITGSTGNLAEDVQMRINTASRSGETPSPDSTGEPETPNEDGLSGGPVGGYVVPTTVTAPDRQSADDEFEGLF